MITVMGIGPGGSSDFLYQRCFFEIEKAQIIIGSRRQLEILPPEQAGKGMVLPKKLSELEDVLKAHQSEAVLVLASGDPMTYGIGKWLCRRFASQVSVLPGVSAIQYLFSKAQIPLEDCYLTSSHGREPDYELIFKLPKVAMVTDAKTGPYQLAQEAMKLGVQKYFLIGENLSYPDEKIRWFKASEVQKEIYQMNVVVITDER